uniref:Uncharacterized protein n=1 Tax=Magallana gigas TaxID=29159 RepID=A0A8W8I6F3_MAGGI
MPLTDEFKDDELKTMAEGFTEMGVKPNLQSKEKFQKWLLDFSTGAKPKSDGATASASTQDKSPNTYQTPRLPNFSGDKKGDATFDLWKQSKYTTKEIPPAITPQNDQDQIREDESELSDESSESESEIDVPVQYAVTEEYTPHDVHVQDVTGEDQQRENVRDAQQADDTDNSFAEHQLPLAEEREETDAVNALSDEELEALEYETEERQERDVRRSTRTRKQPAWLRSGEYVNTIQRKQTKDLEWKQGEKLKYLQSMLLTDIVRLDSARFHKSG